MVSTVVIVGSSVGGVRTAQGLRSAGYTGDVVLVGEESRLPYDKPPLSKALLAGTRTEDEIGLLTEATARDIDIRLMLGRRAAALRPAEQEVVLADGERVRYDHVVIATGASARPSPWGERAGVHVLRTLADSTALRTDLLRGGHLVVVGGGFIGAEVAATARALGLEVTIVDPVDVPMSRVLGTGVGDLFTSLHRDHGVTTRFGIGVDGVSGERGALRVALSDGTVLDAATVVVGIGATPNDGWLADSGLRTDDGVLCDEHCRALDTGTVWAVGDVARWWHRGRAARIRTEHWTNAVEQARVVAHNIAHPGDLQSHEPIEYVWTDQHDWKIKVVGRACTGTPEVIGDPATGGRFAVLYTEDGRTVSGVVAVNWPKAMIAGRTALESGNSFDDVRAGLQAAAVAGPRREAST